MKLTNMIEENKKKKKKIKCRNVCGIAAVLRANIIYD